jgi:S-adenosyl-L-methionine hydrolase (adenosine-forming)
MAARAPTRARRRRASPVVTFLSDYGPADEFVGVCHGVIARRCPAARIIDITHGIPRHDVRAGALALRAALPYMPTGVHLAVVDPGVGSERRAIALATREESRLLVGPDNGLLLAAAAAFGGALEVVDIGASSEALSPVSATFHGRDIFAPVAAALADGAALSSVGEPIEPDGLLALGRARGSRRLGTATREAARKATPDAAPEQRESDGRGYALLARVLSIDGFGNVALNASGGAFAETAQPPKRVLVEIAGEGREAIVGRTFADVAEGELVAYVDSRGALALAVNGGSAAERLALHVDDVLTLRFR